MATIVKAGQAAYDVIVIGAGHNSLVAAAYLARSGRRVLVLERRDVLGGTLASDSFSGTQIDLLQSGTLRSEIVRGLGLKLPGPHPKSAFVSLLPGGERLTLNPHAAAVESIRKHSSCDADRWPVFVRFMDRAAVFLAKSYSTVIPALPRPPLDGALDLARLGLDLRLTGRRDMMNIIRALAMSAYELVEEYFKSDVVRAAVASIGVHGVSMGPLSAGTAFNLIHNWLNRGGLAHRFIGTASATTQALEQAVRLHGGEIRTGAGVTSIDIDGYRCTGVTLSSGESLSAQTVVSGADPRRTLLSLVGPVNLPPEFVWKLQSIRMRGSVARLHLAVDSLPIGMDQHSTCVVAPSVHYLEKASDSAKYGQVSAQPYLELTSTGNVISVHFQHAPYFLKEGNWDDRRSMLEKITIDTLDAYFPGLGSKVIQCRAITPLDLERDFALTEGDLNHGQLMLDQFFFMRPLPGYAGHTTPVDGLYLCGAGIHAGGGISGCSGRNAARVVMRAQPASPAHG